MIHNAFHQLQAIWSTFCKALQCWLVIGFCLFVCLFVCLMVVNVTFNNVLVISWRSVSLVEETTELSQVTDKLYHIMLCTLPWSRFELTTSVVIDTDCIGSCKSNYHTITATTVPGLLLDSTLTIHCILYKPFIVFYIDLSLYSILTFHCILYWPFIVFSIDLSFYSMLSFHFHLC